MFGLPPPRPLATFTAALEERFKAGAIFDRSPAVIGTEWQGGRVNDVEDMEKELSPLSFGNGYTG